MLNAYCICFLGQVKSDEQRKELVKGLCENGFLLILERKGLKEAWELSTWFMTRLGEKTDVDRGLLAELSGVVLMKFIGATYVPGNELFGEPGRWTLGASRKDKGQRAACGCVMSKDIGMYNTCPHLCRYCYANASDATVLANCRRHSRDPHGEFLIPGP